MNPEWQQAQQRYEEHTDALWNAMLELVRLEDELVSARTALAIEDARLTLDPEVLGGTNEKARAAKLLLLSVGDAAYQAAAQDLRGKTIEVAEGRATVEREQMILREWRLALTFLANPKELP